MGTTAAVGLGSNLGDRRAILDMAVAGLAETPGVSVIRVSRFTETPPVGGPGGQGPFLNGAVIVETTLEPPQFLALLRELEGAAGRVRKVRWGERTLDLDLLLHGAHLLESPGLTLPHPRFALRRFVLAPLAEVAPSLIDPATGQTVAGLLHHLDRRPGYVALHGPPGAHRDHVYKGLIQAIGRASIDRGTGQLPAAEGDLAQRALALDSADWPPEALGMCWLITDFCLDLDHREGRARAISAARSRGRANGRLRGFDPAAENELELLVRSAISPTFAVVLAGAEVSRRSRLTDFPLLWAEPGEPEDVIEEVLAACASTRTG